MKPFYKIAILLFVLTSCQSTEENVYDYYQSLPESFFYDADLGDIKYTIQQNEGSWTSKSIAGHEISPIVDIKNGYIEINDEGTGGGNVLNQVVLFRTADNSPVIGITKGGFNGIYFESTTTFYKKRGNKWFEDEHVFPALNIQRFLNSNYRKLEFQPDNKLTPNLSTLIRLPQHGTKIDIELNFNKFDFLIESNQNVHKQQKFSQREVDQLWDIIDNILVQSFQLNFNKEKEIFEVRDSIFLERRGDNQLSVETNKNGTISDEAYVIDMLWNIEKVKGLANYIDTVSDHKRELKLIFEGESESKPGFYQVRGMEDNGGNYVAHLTFYIQKESFEIYEYDVLGDTIKKINK